MFRRPIFVALIAVALAGVACGNTGDLSKTEKTRPAVTVETAPNAQAGQALFTQLGCIHCHVEGAGKIAPSLVGQFGKTVSLEGGETVTADENYIRESILSPQKKIVAGYKPVMPAYEGKITEEQLTSLVDYIESLGD
jgi:cytochrome c oxidase subunit 2